jgi:hypothetical protein
MDTNAVIVVLAEPVGLDDRRDIFGEIVLQEVRQNFLPARLGVLCPFAALLAIGSMAKSSTAVLSSAAKWPVGRSSALDDRSAVWSGARASMSVTGSGKYLAEIGITSAGQK